MGLVGGSLALFTTTALASWMPTFIHRYHGSSVSQAGLTTGLVFLPASVLGVLISGILSDRLLARTPRARLLVAASGLWIGIPFGLFSILTPTWPLYVIGLFLATLCLSSYLTPLMAFVQEAVPSQWRATAMALCLLITQIAGGATAALAVGAVSDTVGLQMAMLLPLAAALLGGTALYLGARHGLSDSAE
jgi:MFS family permease